MEATLREANRLFAALDLPDGLRRLLGAEGARVAAALPARAVPAESLHLTLAFLGRVPTDALPALAAALRGAAGGPPRRALRVRVGATRPHPSARRARLVAADLEDLDGEVAALAGRVRDGLYGALGRAVEQDRFWPHVTLARLARPRAVRLAGVAESEHVFDFRRAALYDSQATPGRPPRYRALVQVPVGAG